MLCLLSLAREEKKINFHAIYCAVRIETWTTSSLSIITSCPSTASEEIHHFSSGSATTSVVVAGAIPIVLLLFVSLGELAVILLKDSSPPTCGRSATIRVIIVEARRI
jgi:hypothetical protein